MNQTDVTFTGARIDSQGRIVVAGYQTYQNAYRLFVRRYVPAGGYDLDKTDLTTTDGFPLGVALDA